MPFRYRKTIKIRDGVKLNVSNSSISLSLGKKGASINIAPKSSHLNLSLPGTGISYRTKIGEGYERKLEELEKSLAPKEKKETSDRVSTPKKTETTSKQQDPSLRLLQSAPQVKPEEVFKQAWYDAFEIRQKILWKRLLDGNRESIEDGVEVILNGLESNANIDVSYELDDHVLYADVDLFEIEEINAYTSLLEQNNGPVLMKKEESEINREYAASVISLGIYLAASFFNVSPYIHEIVLSAYTQRKKEETAEDVYLYSVRFLRAVFEQTDLGALKDPFSFFLQFDNRIKANQDQSLDPIEPFVKETKEEIA